MIEFYLPIKHSHIALALLSGSLFALRGVLALSGRTTWARHAALRYLSYSIDSLLLTAALMLLVLLKLNPLTTPWLATKLCLLVAYVLLGIQALRAEPPGGHRWPWWLAACGGFLTMYSVARAHHPLGALSVLLG